ncbi:MAG: hypothetical protein BGP00_07015 [Novosphingobium sp. 63-713]|uniref:DUF2513 domain-containing protein n=1 Tax=unclassified Novosphingobium TaxID=2644732 RepID=UPI000961269C|nr:MULTISPECIES: DUF2513 domain-containing protein [unclassified Novosphingobium]MBN9142438.1 DUF2513 domain-containing protein [Novosphingobium sp.]OJX97615.1 MAG: hypothetical protein BGP00_07015 [Novosphingobium sp. 63-713]
MRRDMDLIRDLLIEIEDGKSVYELITQEIADILDIPDATTLPKEDVSRVEGHLKMLADAKFISLKPFGGGYWKIEDITWAGHDFIDSVRDPEIWKKTKEGASKAGGFSAELLKDLAKGLLKTQIEKHTGIKLGN